ALKEKIKYYISNEKRDATWAVELAKQDILKIFESIDDEYIKERAVDIKDTTERIIRNLLGLSDNNFESIMEPVILVAHNLTPSDTAKLSKGKVAGFITEVGGKTSHVAIMAESLEIPAVASIGVGFIESIGNNDVAMIDGSSGNVIINPSTEDEQNFEVLKEKYELNRIKLTEFKNKQGSTKDNEIIVIEGNIGDVNDANSVLNNGGEGIGLFRTEFLFMDKDTLPTEEEQFIIYKEVASKFADKPVIIRTLDIGGDKNVPALSLPKEDNPFLGYRAIRISLKEPSLFKTQIKALLRASAFGDIWIMLPMISSLEEILESKKIIEEAKSELKNNNVSFNDKIKIGIMMEIPSAAISANVYAKYVDFFSIGTNDLIQYTLAVDRINEKVSNLYQPLHPSVLQLIKIIASAAKNNNIVCGVCGEMAGEETFAPVLVGLGVKSLSMSASKITQVKYALSKFTMSECKEIASKMLQAESESENREILREIVDSVLKDT
ncbi:MAG: phosphoenolpyruvate--protein phosphotransferase, partial [Lachnospiraceae bacterium]|nr:phosphoenolpyruvate--protein phosphotransferase [Lachnospiraceae bacterium]